MQLNQGFVYTLFSKKGKFVENEVSEIEREIEEIRNKISSYKNEHLMSMRELNVVFADKYLSNYNWLQKSDNDLSEFVTDHLSGNAKDEYLHRRQMLREKLDGNSDKLSQEILRLEQNIVELNDKHLHQIITRENIDNVFSISNTNEIGITTNFNDIKGSEYFDLLKFLIRDGYIDESYADYMTYFYENSLYDDFNISGISDDKIAILIDTKIIRMTTDNLAFIRNNYPDQKFHFIRINVKEYVDTVGKTLFSQNELIEILTWDINDDLKISLLKMSKEPISIIEKGYSTAVCLHILSNNFAESDLPSLFSSFEQWDDSIQEKVFDHAVNNISCIIDNQNSIPKKLIKSLLNSESVSRDEKLDLFAAIMPNLSEADMQSILILLNLTDYLKIFDMRSRPKFEINNESEKLLAAFKECHLIDSYEESTTKAGYYKVARSKATKALSKEPSTVT